MEYLLLEACLDPPTMESSVAAGGWRKRGSRSHILIHSWLQTSFLSSPVPESNCLLFIYLGEGRTRWGGYMVASGQRLDPPHFSASVFPLTFPEAQRETNQNSKRQNLNHPPSCFLSHTPKKAFPLRTVSATLYSWPPRQPLTEREGLPYGKTQTLW